MNKRVHFISMEDITKSFGSVVANKNISFQVYEGEVHALLGENGAGKSTLMNMLSGVYTPDKGSIFVHGKKVSFSSPKDSIKAGIGMIYQHFKLVEAMSARDNIVLGQKISFFRSKKAADEKINSICEKYELNINLDKMVYDMSVAERQILEIIKVLYRGAKILILDEPTTVFTPQDVEKLFRIMRKMKENGCAIIFITHKMDEVMEIADRITVLRKGETIKTLEKDATSPRELAELMVGRSVDLSIKKSHCEIGKSILQVKELKVCNNEGNYALNKVSFDMYKGEVLGIAGIAGSGQKEICEAISGICKINNGEIIFQGENIAGKSPREIMSKGISMSFIPEDRLGMGLVASMDMVENLMLKAYYKDKGIFINRGPVRIKAEEIKNKLDIKTPNIYYPIKNLSGGNIQKILLGRELDCNPHLLIMAYPVRGLDINTCYAIYDLINEQRAKGVSVLFIGEDIDVLMQLCDRIMVICDGTVTGIVDPKTCVKEDIGLLMAGGTKPQTEEGIA
ncbi:ABC transporter ATP-binding protein [Clostridium sp. UBA4548]|uniref:ABC transporter ATP-binding protein n=1 Tax=Clostridium sp. UBA4548 TaxID=1946361 RepID=UPI0025BC3798|nr:ABC transporter ATP-binding protein [Clostridium sp. UBA4548]